jgi:integrase
MSSKQAMTGIPSYTRHKASGQAVVRLSGVDHYLGRFNSPESRVEYNRVIAEWLARGRRPADPSGDGSDTRMKELIAGYHSYLVGTQPEIDDKIRLALKAVRELYGETPAAKFGPVAFKAIRLKMVESGLSITTIRDRMGVIRRMVAWGVENELLPADALQRIKAVSGLRAGRDGVKASRKVKPVAEEHIEAILPHVSPTIRAMIELQRLTGMRPGEVWRITTGQIDRTVDPWIYQPTQHKTVDRGKDRAIPIGPRAQQVLAAWLKADPDKILFSPIEAMGDHWRELRARRKTKVQPSQRDRRVKNPKRKRHDTYNRFSYGNAIERGCLRAGIPVFTANQIRHTYATRVRREFGLEAAQVLLGHSKADVTQIYAEKNAALARDVAAQIG